MRQARLLLVTFAALLPAQRLPTPGEVVFPAERIEISSTPGAPPHTQLNSSPALVLSTSGSWRRLLGANGTTGWSRIIPQHFAPASAQASEMMSRSPDDADFASEAESMTVAPDQKASVTGASRKSRTASMSQLQLPEWANPFLTPWLKLKAGSQTGWQAPSLLSLIYTAPVAGLIRAPFLGPLVPTLNAWRPAAGEPVWRFPDLRTKPEKNTPSSGDFGEAELVLELPEGSGQVITKLAVFPGKTGRLFTVQTGGKDLVHAVVESYAPLVTGFATADLNRDGANELLLEMIQTYGDGWFSTLWVVDGKSTGANLEVSAVPLAGVGGEPGASATDAFWWVENGILWIVRGGKEPGATAVSYRDGKLSALHQKAYAVVLGHSKSRLEAERAAWAAHKRLGRPVHVFRDFRPGKKDVWLAGCLFQQLKDAQQLHGLEVVPYPAGSL